MIRAIIAALLFVPALALASITADFDASWDAPTTWSDGSPMSQSDIDHYVLECTRDSVEVLSETLSGTATSYSTTVQLESGEHNCSLTAFDDMGQPGDPALASFTVNPPPGSPSNLIITISVSFSGS